MKTKNIIIGGLAIAVVIAILYYFTKSKAKQAGIQEGNQYANDAHLAAVQVDEFGTGYYKKKAIPDEDTRKIMGHDAYYEIIKYNESVPELNEKRKQLASEYETLSGKDAGMMNIESLETQIEQWNKMIEVKDEIAKYSDIDEFIDLDDEDTNEVNELNEKLANILKKIEEEKRNYQTLTGLMPNSAWITYDDIRDGYNTWLVNERESYLKLTGQVANLSWTKISEFNNSLNQIKNAWAAKKAIIDFNGGGLVQEVCQGAWWHVYPLDKVAGPNGYLSKLRNLSTTEIAYVANVYDRYAKQKNEHESAMSFVRAVSPQGRLTDGKYGWGNRIGWDVVPQFYAATTSTEFKNAHGKEFNIYGKPI